MRINLTQSLITNQQSPPKESCLPRELHNKSHNRTTGSEPWVYQQNAQKRTTFARTAHPQQLRPQREPRWHCRSSSGCLITYTTSYRLLLRATRASPGGEMQSSLPRLILALSITPSAPALFRSSANRCNDSFLAARAEKKGLFRRQGEKILGRAQAKKPFESVRFLFSRQIFRWLPF